MSPAGKCPAVSPPGHEPAPRERSSVGWLLKPLFTCSNSAGPLRRWSPQGFAIAKPCRDCFLWPVRSAAPHTGQLATASFSGRVTSFVTTDVADVLLVLFAPHGLLQASARTPGKHFVSKSVADPAEIYFWKTVSDEPNALDRRLQNGGETTGGHEGTAIRQRTFPCSTRSFSRSMSGPATGQVIPLPWQPFRRPRCRPAALFLLPLAQTFPRALPLTR